MSYRRIGLRFVVLEIHLRSGSGQGRIPKGL